MLFLISWSIPTANRVSCWNIFGNMTPADDIKDMGDHIKMVGRWHYLSGDGGVIVFVKRMTYPLLTLKCLTGLLFVN